MTQEQVILVDPQDNAIGLEEKMRAHELGLLHRAFSVFIYRKEGGTLSFLLQQRHPDKYHCGGLWTNACCSHPRNNEDTLAAATRRLQEELALSIPLKLIGRFIYKAHFDNGLIEHELDYVLVGKTDETCVPDPHPLEVSQTRWMSVACILKDLEENPGNYTPWFNIAFEIVLEELCYHS